LKNILHFSIKIDEFSCIFFTLGYVPVPVRSFERAENSQEPTTSIATRKLYNNTRVHGKEISLINPRGINGILLFLDRAGKEWLEAFGPKY
jgi:hypothetical protein